tara:strand:+ start:3369 stop:4538 length:1170 start_codon:yes stop_codon:yes gene_type:complete
MLVLIVCGSYFSRIFFKIGGFTVVEVVLIPLVCVVMCFDFTIRAKILGVLKDRFYFFTILALTISFINGSVLGVSWVDQVSQLRATAYFFIMFVVASNLNADRSMAVAYSGIVCLIMYCLFYHLYGADFVTAEYANKYRIPILLVIGVAFRFYVGGRWLIALSVCLVGVYLGVISNYRIYFAVLILFFITLVLFKVGGRATRTMYVVGAVLIIFSFYSGVFGGYAGDLLGDDSRASQLIVKSEILLDVITSRAGVESETSLSARFEYLSIIIANGFLFLAPLGMGGAANLSLDLSPSSSLDSGFLHGAVHYGLLFSTIIFYCLMTKIICRGRAIVRYRKVAWYLVWVVILIYVSTTTEIFFVPDIAIASGFGAGLLLNRIFWIGKENGI